jgi:hypothetical protein
MAFRDAAQASLAFVAGSGTVLATHQEFASVNVIMGLRRVTAVACIVGLQGCVALHPRQPLPSALLVGARPEGFPTNIRFWGDVVSPDLRAGLSQQYAQLRGTAAASRSAITTRADFLAISGGGGDGAYAAGLLKGWSERGTRPVFEVVTGVSTGALAAPFAFLGSDYDNSLAEIYTAYGDEDLYRSNGPLGLLGASMNDTAPLRLLIERYVTDNFLDRIAAEGRLGRRLLVQTTNLDAQRPIIWDMTAIAASDSSHRREFFVRLLLASAAIPAVFPPQRIRVTAEDGHFYDELHVDGGVSSQVFFAPPQMQLEDIEMKTFGHTRIRTLYVVRNGKLGPEYQNSEEKTLSIATRSIAALIKGQSLADLGNLARAARASRTQFRFSAIPESFSVVADGDFDRRYMSQLYEVGRSVGRDGRWSQASATPSF